MSTNQMRREAAKRKLERQQERRVQQAKRKRTVAVITSAAVVVVVLVGVVLLSTLGGGEPEQNTEAAAAPAAGAPGSCAYPPSGEPAKPVEAPPTGDVSAEGTVPVTLQTSAGTIPLTLDRAAAPCTVNSFVSLAQQGYFDATTCHRLTTTEGLKVLQCGDPSASGSGGPGYTIADEPPTGLAPAADQPGAVIYPRGTVAMAKTAQPDSGGSQFFLVYADSTLPPSYTVFGTIAEPGRTVLDDIAAGGLTNETQPGDGAPATPVTIETATVG